MRKKTTRKTNVQAQKKTTGQSQFSLLFGKATFTNEPIWYRIAIILIIVIAVAVTCRILKEWVFPVIGQHLMGPGITPVISSFKGRAP